MPHMPRCLPPPSAPLSAVKPTLLADCVIGRSPPNPQHKSSPHTVFFCFCGGHTPFATPAGRGLRHPNLDVAPEKEASHGGGSNQGLSANVPGAPSWLCVYCACAELRPSFTLCMFTGADAEHHAIQSPDHCTVFLPPYYLSLIQSSLSLFPNQPLSVRHRSPAKTARALPRQRCGFQQQYKGRLHTSLKWR